MTFMLPQGSLDLQRMMNVASLPHLAKILLRSEAAAAAGDGGGVIAEYTDEDYAEELACRLTAAKQSEPEAAIADQLTSVGRFICTFDLGADIPADARLIVSGSEHSVDWSILLDVKARLNPLESANAVMEQYYCEPVPEGAQA